MKQIEKFEIQVRFANKIFALTVQSLSLIKAVQELILVKQCILPSHQVLVFDDKVLKIEMTLKEANIKQDSVVELYVLVD